VTATPEVKIRVPLALMQDQEDRYERIYDYLRERLLGRVPTDLEELLDAYVFAEPGPVEPPLGPRTLVIVGEDGEPLSFSSDDNEYTLTEEEEASIDAYFESEQYAESERYSQWLEESGAQEANALAYDAWLEYQAEEFKAARAEWERRQAVLARAAYRAWRAERLAEGATK